MKKIILVLSLVLSLNAYCECSNYYYGYEPEATQTTVNDSTVIFHNVDVIEITQSDKNQTLIVDVDTNKLVAKITGSGKITLDHKGNYMIISRKRFTKTDVRTLTEHVYM